MNKILVACNSGLGTSLMIRINLEAIIRELGCSISVEHTDVTSLRTFQAKLVVCSSYIVDYLEDNDDMEVIALNDIMDRQYLYESLMKSPTFQQWLLEER